MNSVEEESFLYFISKIQPTTLYLFCFPFIYSNWIFGNLLFFPGGVTGRAHSFEDPSAWSFAEDFCPLVFTYTFIVIVTGLLQQVKLSIN